MSRFPIFVVSKGRWQYCLTMKALEKMNIPYRVVVEEPEYTNYAQAIGKEKLLILDMAYKASYETCDDLGDAKSKGPGPARNFAWDIAKSEGHEWHWVMDDNIRAFYRFTNGRRVRAIDNLFFQQMEDFVLRYKNVSMAGPNYKFFVPEVIKLPPIVLNTRIYSCNLIRNDVNFRWRGRYNEDTIISLDMLTSGLCTIQFNAFLQDKLRTQAIGGGNTEEFYAKEGTFNKSKMLVDIYPQFAKPSYRYGREHHYVDYRPFKKNRLRVLE